VNQCDSSPAGEASDSEPAEKRTSPEKLADDGERSDGCHGCVPHRRYNYVRTRHPMALSTPRSARRFGTLLDGNHDLERPAAKRATIGRARQPEPACAYITADAPAAKTSRNGELEAAAILAQLNLHVHPQGEKFLRDCVTQLAKGVLIYVRAMIAYNR
jgi:hypothetical protein